MLTKRVRKRCQACGAVQLVRARQRRCHRPKFGRGSYACWGSLVRVVRPRPGARTVREAVQAMAEEGDVEVTTERHGAITVATVTGKPAARPQDIAARKLDETRRAIGRAQVRLNEHARKVAQEARAIRRLERSAAHYAKRASMTDAEVAADHARRVDRPKKVRRGMKVGGGSV